MNNYIKILESILNSPFFLIPLAIILAISTWGIMFKGWGRTI